MIKITSRVSNGSKIIYILYKTSSNFSYTSQENSLYFVRQILRTKEYEL